MSEVKTPAEIEIMAEGGRRLALILQTLKAETRAGTATSELEKLSRKLIKEAGARPAFLGYRPAGSRKAYPFSLCVSVNDCVVHGQPSAYVIKDGDIVKLDLGLKHRGFYLDAAITLGVGRITREAQKLIEVTRDSLDAAIREAAPGKTLGDIGHAVEKLAKKNGFSVARELTGHGIGRALHEEPSVFNFGRPGQGDEITAGMVLAIEPMIAAGLGAVRLREDESFATADGSLAAHLEHTVAITENGPRVLTAV